MATIFEQYQKKGLLPKLGGSDDIQEKLKKSALDIAEKLQETPHLILPYALVAFDNGVLEGEPVLEAVENDICKHWGALRSEFMEMPIALYRVILLQALEHLVSKNPKMATIIWFAVSDAYPFLETRQNERTILQPFLHEIGEKAEKLAIEDWTVSKEAVKIDMPTVDFVFNKIEKMVNANKIQAGLEILRSTSNYNTQLLQTDSAANKIVEGLPQGTTDVYINANFALIKSKVGEYLTEFAKNTELALKSTIQTSIAVERRSQLLWWKETLYSRRLRKSYRDLSLFECAIAMAVDLYDLLPEIFPISTDFLLRETFHQIHGKDQTLIPLQSFLQEVNEEKQESFLKSFFADTKIEGKRTHLVQMIQKIIYSKVNIPTQMIPMIGIAPNKQVHYAEISVWILHGMAVNRLTNPA